MVARVTGRALALALVPALLAAALGAPLMSPRFYARTCPRLEAVVSFRVAAAIAKDVTVGPALIRLLFHDCFVRGCDASLLLLGSPALKAEITAVPNQSVRGTEVIDDIKAHVEALCPGVVSCADLIVLAARDAVRLFQGPSFPVTLGRRDGVHSNESEAGSMIPSSHANTTKLMKKFQAKGLTLVDMVTLAGAHTVGRGLCTRVQARMMPPDPTLDINYLRTLIGKCSQGGTGAFNPNFMVSLDAISPQKFDNQYYKNLLVNHGLLTSDQTLMANPVGAALVQRYAQDEATFFRQFAISFTRMSLVQVLTGNQGQIRKNCRSVNLA